MYICRRLFVVPLANNDHGKSTIIRSMVSQAVGREIALHRKKQRDMITPWGRPVNAYIFGRSYQEVEKNRYGTIIATLDGNDPDWRSRELIVMPSHVAPTDISDIQEMIDAAHAAGFDAIAVPVVYVNPQQDDPTGQLWALGNDLWSWVSRALTH
jgi:hypothetical protein